MRVEENRSSYYSWPIFHDKAWAPSEFFQESCIDSSMQINELHPPGRSSAPLPVPAPSQEFCITPNVSERQLFSSTFSSALNKSVWSANCIMKAQNHGDGTDCTGQHYQAERGLGFVFFLADFFTRNKTKICQRKFPTPSWRRQEAGSKWKWPCLSLEDKPRGNVRKHINKHQHRKRGRRSSWQMHKDLQLIFLSIAFQGHHD